MAISGRAHPIPLALALPVSVPTSQVIHGNAYDVLHTLPSGSVHMVLTSPPYFGLRDYGVLHQIGLEGSVQEWLGRLLTVFAEVRRVLRPDGVLWVNMGDAYVTTANGGIGWNAGVNGVDRVMNMGTASRACRRNRSTTGGLQMKDMMGQPWRLAFALQDAGWILRRDIVWHKLNPLPETAQDRPHTAHEYVFMFVKQRHYFYDAMTVKEPCSNNTHSRGDGVHRKVRTTVLVNGGYHHAVPQVAGWQKGKGRHDTIKHARPNSQVVDGNSQAKFSKSDGRAAVNLRDGRDFGRQPGWRSRQNASFSAAVKDVVETRHCRSVWTMASQPFHGAHFATFPEELCRRPILACCPLTACAYCGKAAAINTTCLECRSRLTDPSDLLPGVVLDCFAGSGTVGLVAKKLGRRFIGIELNPKTVIMARERIAGAKP